MMQKGKNHQALRVLRIQFPTGFFHICLDGSGCLSIIITSYRQKEYYCGRRAWSYPSFPEPDSLVLQSGKLLSPGCLSVPGLAPQRAADRFFRWVVLLSHSALSKSVPPTALRRRQPPPPCYLSGTRRASDKGGCARRTLKVLRVGYGVEDEATEEGADLSTAMQEAPA